MYPTPARNKTSSNLLKRMPRAHTNTVVTMPCKKGCTLSKIPNTPWEIFKTYMPFLFVKNQVVDTTIKRNLFNKKKANPQQFSKMTKLELHEMTIQQHLE